MDHNKNHFPKKITIIGAGIGGLTTAIALEQKGFEVEIFESFPEMKRMGAGIVLANNAMKVYERLGLKEIIFQNSQHISSLKIVDQNLEVLSKINLKPFEEKLGVHYVGIHRGTLQQILIEQLKTTQLHLGKKLQHLIEVNDEIQLFFEDSSSHSTHCLLGADGIHSKVRQHYFEKTVVRDAYQVCWRGVTKFDLPKKFSNEINEAWGKGTRFGIVPLANGEVYWFAVARYKKDFRKEFKIEDLEEIYKDYHPIVGEIISKTSKENILTNEINDLKPLKNWFSKNMCLIGDAAHATTPNMGQGACQAIEDALAIAICLEGEKDLQRAFSKFQKIRMKKANGVINQSWQIGKMAHWENGIGRSLRNFILKMTPESIAAKQSAKIFELNY